MTFSPDGAKLAVASRLDVAFIDVASMQIESSLPEASGRDLVYAPDGDHIYLDMLGSIKMIDTRAHIVALSFPDPFALVPTLSVAADGTVLGVTYESPERVDGFVLAPDGSQIASYTVEHLLGEQPEADNVRLALWDAKTGKFSGETRFSGNNLRSIEFSPDGDRLALGNGSEVWVWEATTWQLKEKLIGHVGDVIDLSFAADGTRLLSAGSDGTIRRWSLVE